MIVACLPVLSLYVQEVVQLQVPVDPEQRQDPVGADKAAFLQGSGLGLVEFL